MTVLGASMGLNGMKRLPGGEFAMGPEDFYPEEALRSMFPAGTRFEWNA